MSWSASTSFKWVKNGLVPDELSAMVASGQDYAKKERDEQLEAAKGAALRCLVEGGFDNAEEVAVNLSGHANEGHNEIKGAAESINISVYVKKYRAG
jgi:hypothetical protein